MAALAVGRRPAELSQGARRAVGTSAVHTGLAAVADLVGALSHSAEVDVADAAGAVAGLLARTHRRGTCRAVGAPAVDVLFVAVEQPITAGGCGAAALDTGEASAVDRLDTDQPTRAPVAVAPPAVHVRLRAVEHRIFTRRRHAETVDAHAGRAPRRAGALGNGTLRVAHASAVHADLIAVGDSVGARRRLANAGAAYAAVAVRCAAARRPGAAGRAVGASAVDASLLLIADPIATWVCRVLTSVARCPTSRGAAGSCSTTADIAGCASD